MNERLTVINKRSTRVLSLQAQVPRMAEANCAWGNRCIQSAFKNLCYRIDVGTGRNVWPRHHLDPAPRRRVPIGLVLADAEFDSACHHQHIRPVLQAHCIMPAKRGRGDWRMHGVRARMRQDCPRREYAPRSPIESVISAVTRKLSGRALGRFIHTQCLQALLLGVPYDICHL
jgi:hypothetical protein